MHRTYFDFGKFRLYFARGEAVGFYFYSSVMHILRSLIWCSQYSALVLVCGWFAFHHHLPLFPIDRCIVHACYVRYWASKHLGWSSKRHVPTWGLSFFWTVTTLNSHLNNYFIAVLFCAAEKRGLGLEL